jgi:tRNA (Thr-GGU) A37 N-methylase
VSTSSQILSWAYSLACHGISTGRQLAVKGLDAVVGTQVLDIKPVIAEFLPTAIRQPEWPARLMSEYFPP